MLFFATDKTTNYPCIYMELSFKAETHQPNYWTAEALGETQTRSGTNMFGVFSCVGSFRSRADVVCSDSTCGGWLSAVWAIGFSDWLCASCRTILIGGVLANQRSMWEGWNTVCALYTLLWSWQHVQACRSNVQANTVQIFCRMGQTRGNTVAR